MVFRFVCHIVTPLSCATVSLVAMSKTHDAVEMRAADSDSSVDGYSGTSQDAKDMYRLGRSQELKVWSTLSLWIVHSSAHIYSTEKFPFNSNPWPDLCNYVHMDGYLVVSALVRDLMFTTLILWQDQYFFSHQRWQSCKLWTNCLHLYQGLTITLGYCLDLPCNVDSHHTCKQLRKTGLYNKHLTWIHRR